MRWVDFIKEAIGMSLRGAVGNKTLWTLLIIESPGVTAKWIAYNTHRNRFHNDNGIDLSRGHNNPKYHLITENQNNWSRNWYNYKKIYIYKFKGIVREFSNPL